jgi:hypothetical protein
MGVAKELGYTLSELTKRVTLEELIMWSVYFDVYNEEQEASMKKARRR